MITAHPEFTKVFYEYVRDEDKRPAFVAGGEAAEQILTAKYNKETEEFSEWTSANAVYKGNGQWIYWGTPTSTNELLQLFRKEKGI